MWVTVTQPACSCNGWQNLRRGAPGICHQLMCFCVPGLVTATVVIEIPFATPEAGRLEFN